MSNPFFDHPILNSPYERPQRHWELDEHGQPTQRTIENRRRAEFITPIPKPKKRKGSAGQDELVLDEGRVAETGTHAALLASGGLYARMWSRQSGGFVDLAMA